MRPTSFKACSPLTCMWVLRRNFVHTPSRWLWHCLAPDELGPFWNLSEPSGTCTCHPHRHTPEPIWAEDRISLLITLLGKVCGRHLHPGVPFLGPGGNVGVMGRTCEIWSLLAWSTTSRRHDPSSKHGARTPRIASQIPARTAQGVGGSFKDRRPIGEVDCCDAWIAEPGHWWIERWVERRPIYLSIYLPV